MGMGTPLFSETEARSFKGITLIVFKSTNSDPIFRATLRVEFQKADGSGIAKDRELDGVQNTVFIRSSHFLNFQHLHMKIPLLIAYSL
jgi:hypothetical protein